MNAAQIVLMLLALAAVTYCRRTPLNSKKIAVSNNVKTISTVTADASDDTNTPSNSQIYSAVALVSGTTVGAGILALPSVAQETGFLPSTGALVGSWLFMLATGCLIAEVSCNLVKTDAKFVNAGILAMSKHLLGEKMAAVTGLFYLFIHYALLVAYIAEAGGIITDTLHINKLLGPLLFTGVIGMFS